jgi:RNA polymerase sigma-70 factor (ECF subfamily)
VEDAVFSMPPWASWWRGRETIAGFAKTAHETCPDTRSVPTRANGQTALAYYAWDPETGRYLPSAIDVITFEGSLIKEITGFITPEIFPRFGLPADLAR